MLLVVSRAAWHIPHIAHHVLVGLDVTHCGEAGAYLANENGKSVAHTVSAVANLRQHDRTSSVGAH